MAILESPDWHRIPGYEYNYQINDLGQMRKVNPDGSIIKLRPHKNISNGVWTISLRVAKNKRKHVAVKYLMDEVFFDGYAKKNGLCITHKNGISTDCSKYNLLFMTPHELGKRKKTAEKRVAKIDQNGKIVAYYASGKEAARKNFISANAVSNRTNNLLQNPWELDGYNYQFVEDLP